MTPSNDSIATARASYERCCASPDFLPTFYHHFFEACPKAKPMFAQTNFTTQVNLLRHAIGLLFIFPNHPGEERTVLSRLAERHSRRDLRVDPEMYPAWVDSLVRTASQFDPQFSPDIEGAWRKAIAPGIAYMRERF